MLHFSVSNTSAKLGKYPHSVIYHKVQPACPTRLIKCCWMKIWFRQAFLNSSHPFLKCNYTLIFLIKGNNLHKWITKNSYDYPYFKSYFRSPLLPCAHILCSFPNKPSSYWLFTLTSWCRTWNRLEPGKTGLLLPNGGEAVEGPVR